MEIFIKKCKYRRLSGTIPVSGWGIFCKEGSDLWLFVLDRRYRVLRGPLREAKGMTNLNYFRVERMKLSKTNSIHSILYTWDNGERWLETETPLA